MKSHLLVLTMALLTACGGSQKGSADTAAVDAGPNANPQAAPQPVGPEFMADSAFAFCQRQCDFGPRTMNSDAHEHCAQWIAGKFQAYGLAVTKQQATLTGFDGTPLHATNIIASYRPEQPDRILVCAHWDSRPWADNDPDESNHQKPVLAANDGASGVAVMLELARLVSSSAQSAKNSAPNYGIDFICFDAEDWGTHADGDSWALGSHYWASHPHQPGYKARFGILLDMVGGQNARFYREGHSQLYASQTVNTVWRAAETVGFSTFFPKQDGGFITDDHIPVNELAGIPCIDIVPFYPNCEESNFGPTWHTVKDDMSHIAPGTLKAVGQTLVQVLWEMSDGIE
ncbi:MAG: M28 family peptidase [Prevotella sp.]|nr:M28 family peptidase [Prevotella sp.]